ncbi:MAG: hypothetical protein AAF739_01445 [Pseudomonadota bacterium]
MRHDLSSNDAKKRRDFDDLQNEITGMDPGRIQRFLSEGDGRSPGAKRRKRVKEAEQRRLVELLTDPIYRATYERLGSQLSEAETHADQTIQRYETAIQAAQTLLADMEADAARGPDGQLVFRYADGRVVDADGRDVTPEIAAGITWPENAPSAEAYFAAKEQLNSLENELHQWRGYRTDTLGSIRDRHDNDDNPMSLDEMDDALDRIESTQPAIFALPAAEPEVIAAPPATPSAPSLPTTLN